MHAAGRDAHRPGHALHDALDFKGLFLQRVEVVAENLHAELRANARAEHQDAVFDRLEETGNVAGDVRELLRQLGFEHRGGHAVAPLGIAHDGWPWDEAEQMFVRREVLGLEDDRGLDHLDGRRIGGGLGPAKLAGDAGDLGDRANDFVLPAHDALDLRERRARQQHRHEKKRAFVQGRHELAPHPAKKGPKLRILGAESGEPRPRQTDNEHDRAGQQQRGAGQDALAPAQGPGEDRVVNGQQRAHDPVALLGVERPAHEQGGEHGHNRHCKQRRADHGEGFCEGERVEQLSALAAEGKNRKERQNDDGHREKDRPANLPGSIEDDLPGFGEREANARPAPLTPALSPRCGGRGRAVGRL